ncbi:DUF2807 domain-containing protein [Dyadobacter sp. CY261]|uniref:head GIN domain-containing protein n=1 Tax=Dyadobacter sp. CY261 TaxID=2907203 RepID=UPI001F475326|nr:head GIN domain-containing protein [Dyadobacter sp. CY261]MCF0072143.1 DUF2807 domain-containing protein [Dyadobacter sp. CY261]
MKRTQLFLIAALLITALSCQVSAQETRKFSVSGFTKLSIGSAFKIDVKQGSSFSVTATGRSEDLEDMESSVRGGTLHLGYKSNGWNKNRKTVDISITLPALDGVDFSGASKANVARFNGVKTMDIEVSGASQVTMSLSSPKVTVDLSGASSLILTGDGDILTGEVSGASSFKGRDFSAKTVNIDASGASSAAVLANATLNAEASGASSVRYSGSVKDVHSSTSGASSVKRD